MSTNCQSSESSQVDDAVRRAQIKAYVDWMNAQLKKRPGTRLVEDLKCDLQDGVALINLISIVAGRQLENVHEAPSNSAEKEQNISQVIAFMTERKIKMHYTTAKDIVGGNLKAIMRMILALAAHYKPNSVKQSSRSGSRATTPLTGIAQSAAVAIADARRDAAKAGHRPKRPSHLDRLDRQETPGYAADARHSIVDGASSSGESPSMFSDFSSPHRLSNHGNGASPATVGRRLEFGAMPKSRSQDFGAGHEHHSQIETLVEESERKSVVIEALREEHSRLENDLNETRGMLLTLQELLLNGRLPETSDSVDTSSDQACSPAQWSNSSEEVVVLQSKLQQAEETARLLRAELSNERKNSLQLQGVKAGLQQRLSEQENSFLVLKAELLRAGFCQQSLENTKNELEQRLREKDEMFVAMQKELLQQENAADELKVERHLHQGALHDVSRNFKTHIINLHDKIQKLGDTESTLSERMISQDQRLAELEEAIIRRQNRHRDNPSGSGSFEDESEDFQLVRESLRCLRNRFHSDDPQHRAIDALEQSISILMDRLNVTEEHRWMDPVASSRNEEGRSSRLSLSRQDNSLVSSQGSTKVLYFTDRTVTPFMYTIPKQLGDIVLNDIKGILDRPGNFRYHFKTMDPEFGTVKEEITQDDAVIPGWEGKIVAWIEEDRD